MRIRRYCVSSCVSQSRVKLTSAVAGMVMYFWVMVLDALVGFHLAHKFFQYYLTFRNQYFLVQYYY